MHPTAGVDWTSDQKHEISFICDDIEATVADLRDRGAQLPGEVADLGFGLAIQLQIPGGPEVMLYSLDTIRPPSPSDSLGRPATPLMLGAGEVVRRVTLEVRG